LKKQNLRKKYDHLHRGLGVKKDVFHLHHTRSIPHKEDGVAREGKTRERKKKKEVRGKNISCARGKKEGDAFGGKDGACDYETVPKLE